MTNEAPPADVEAVVLEAFIQVMGQAPPRGEQTEPSDVDTWTSLTHIHLIAEIEDLLGTELPQDVLVSMGSFGELVRAASAAVR